MNFRQRVLLVKIETVYGTDAVPVGATDALIVANLSVKPMQNEMVDRNTIQGYFGHQQQIPVSTQMMCDFDVEMQGSGAAGTAPAWGKLLKAAGMAEVINAGVSVVYSPAASASALTVYYHVDGVRHKLLGARGNVKCKTTPRGIPYLSFSLTGLYGGIADAALPAATISQGAPIAVNNANTPAAAFALHGYQGKMYDFDFDMGNQVVYRNLVGAEDVIFTDRAPVGNIEIEMPTITTKDYFTIARTPTLGAFTLTHGVTAGSKVKLDAANVQIINPEETDRDNVVGLKMGLRFVPGATGNDEFTITAL